MATNFYKAKQQAWRRKAQAARDRYTEKCWAAERAKEAQ